MHECKNFVQNRADSKLQKHECVEVELPLIEGMEEGTMVAHCTRKLDLKNVRQVLEHIGCFGEWTENQESQFQMKNKMMD